MNALHPIFAAALAPYAPQPVRVMPPIWRVKVVFSDGTYTNKCVAETSERAINLAIIDARMVTPYGSYRGKVLSTEVEPASL